MTERNLVAFAGRVSIAILFISAGLMFFRAPDFHFAESILTANGIPLPKLALILTIVLQLGCGALLFMRRFAGYAALILAIWMIPATLVFHHFWTSPPPERADQVFHFLKNIAICGGLLMVYASYSPRCRSSSQSLASNCAIPIAERNNI
jgi:putative oxidoreductase